MALIGTPKTSSSLNEPEYTRPVYRMTDSRPAVSLSCQLRKRKAI
jgi:hypothetical protein